MKNLTYLLLAVIALNLGACKKDDDNKDNQKPPVENTTLEGEISSNKTLTANNKYTLKGNVYVTNGATLTVEPGTVIFGDKGSKAALIITRGCKIVAEGTADKPIVFTSSAPAGFRNRGDWAGIVMLGKARHNQEGIRDIEGLPKNANSQFGGTEDGDNSGVLKFVRIEFAGIALTPDNELNSLTMGGVGSGTTINHVQVSYANDDAFEWFGGTVNASHLIAYKSLDDDFDTDFGYTGTVDHGVVVRDPSVADVSGSNAFESDNDGSASTRTPKTKPTFDYVTVIGPYASKASNISANYLNGAHIKKNSDIQIKNTIIVGYTTGVNFDNAGSEANVMNVILAKNKDAASKITFGRGTFPAGADTTQVEDQNMIFNGTGFKNIDNPNPSDVKAPFNDAGAFAGNANWNWGTPWINFDPINVAY